MNEKKEMPEWWQRDRTGIVLCCANGILTMCFGLNHSLKNWNNSNITAFSQFFSGKNLLMGFGINLAMILFFHEMGKQNRFLMNKIEDVPQKNDTRLRFFPDRNEIYLHIIDGGSWAFNYCIPHPATFPWPRLGGYW